MWLRNGAPNLDFSKKLGSSASFCQKKTANHGKKSSGPLGGAISMLPFCPPAKLSEPASEHLSMSLKPFFSNLDASATSHHLIATRINQHFSTIALWGLQKKPFPNCPVSLRGKTQFSASSRDSGGFLRGLNFSKIESTCLADIAKLEQLPLAWKVAKHFFERNGEIPFSASPS